MRAVLRPSRDMGKKKLSLITFVMSSVLFLYRIVKYEVKIEDAQLRGQVKVIVISEGSVAAGNFSLLLTIG